MGDVPRVAISTWRRSGSRGGPHPTLLRHSIAGRLMTGVGRLRTVGNSLPRRAASGQVNATEPSPRDYRGNDSLRNGNCNVMQNRQFHGRRHRWSDHMNRAMPVTMPRVNDVRRPSPTSSRRGRTAGSVYRRVRTAAIYRISFALTGFSFCAGDRVIS